MKYNVEYKLNRATDNSQEALQKKQARLTVNEEPVEVTVLEMELQRQLGRMEQVPSEEIAILSFEKSD